MSSHKETDPLLSGKSEKVSARGSPLELFGLIPWLRTLQQEFGHKLLVMLFLIQHLQKGFVNSYVAMASPYIYRVYHVPAARLQVFGGVTQVPWAMKPIIGLMSDILPIMGYNKAPYVLITCAAAAVALVCLGALPIASVMGIVVCLLFNSLQQSTCDLLSEAKYAEKIRAAPSLGPSILTYVWFGMTAAGLLATLCSGPMIHYFGARGPCMFLALPALLICVPTLMGYMEEKKVSAEELQQIRQRYREQKEACFLCVLIFAATIALIITAVVSPSVKVNCAVAVGVGVLMLICFSVVLSPVIAMFNAFSLIQTSIGVSIGGASFYFYTDTPEQYPEGPHFSEIFYNSVLSTAGSLFSLVGIVLYQRYMSTWKYRHLMITTNIVISLLSVFDILMFSRVNVKLGIPDHILAFGLTVFQTVIFQWQWMPQVVILSYLCPKGMEATMYALLAGAHNLGNTISANTGALLLDLLEIRPSGSPNESAQFEKLWIASTISTVLPLVGILLLYRLLPDARQNERLVTDTEYDCTSGSLWSRWKGGQQ